MRSEQTTVACAQSTAVLYSHHIQELLNSVKQYAIIHESKDDPRNMFLMHCCGYCTNPSPVIQPDILNVEYLDKLWCCLEYDI